MLELLLVSSLCVAYLLCLLCFYTDNYLIIKMSSQRMSYAEFISKAQYFKEGPQKRQSMG